MTKLFRRFLHGTSKPSFTLIAPRSLPTQKKSMLQKMGSIFTTGRQFALQYIKGGQQLSKNARLVGEIKKRISKKGYIPTRNESLLIYDTEDDFRKVIPFFMILIVLPESLPFLLMRGSDIIPSTCTSQEQI
ncbi:hypothetical protein HK096_002494, partial [Nowakowskiella sp. JEL0078]